MLWLETPTNPMVGIADLSRLAEAARERGIPTVVDNTFATPLLQRPLELGCDVVVHSGTKLIGGHSDLLLGIAVARDARAGRGAAGRAPRRGRHAWRAGGVAGAPRPAHAACPSRAHAGDGAPARRAAARPPGGDRGPLPRAARRPGPRAGEPADGRLRDDARLPGGGGSDQADALCESVQLITHATSLGGVETLIENRAAAPGEEHLPEGLLRLSVGCEHPEDVWEDLDAALAGERRLPRSGIEADVEAPGGTSIPTRLEIPNRLSLRAKA